MPDSEHAGGDNGFTEYASAARSGLRRQAFLLCGDWYEADDLVQDTLLKLYRRWRRLRRRDQLEGYAHATLVRTFLNARRGLRRRREILTADPLDRPDRAFENLTDTVELRVALRIALNQLPEPQRAVLVLRFFEDRPVQEVARILGIPASTVASHTHRALIRLHAARENLR
jgi:RNA polymerase sigma-70 factor (sigma-E family)